MALPIENGGTATPPRRRGERWDSEPMNTSAMRTCISVSPGEAVTRPLKTSEAVARDVVHHIITQGLQTGDRLPSEAAMLDDYGVSRESLREGLRLLEVQGLITIRRGPGGGPIVGLVDPAHLGRISSLYYHLAGGTYVELVEAWLLTESTLAHRAATNPDRVAVRAAMERFATDGDADDEVDNLVNFVHTRAHFHAVVASFAANRVLEIMLQSIGQIVTHHIVVNADPREIDDMIGRDHRAIARAIASGHPRKARAAMEDHIEGLSQFYRDQIGDRMQDYIEWR